MKRQVTLFVAALFLLCCLFWIGCSNGGGGEIKGSSSSSSSSGGTGVIITLATGLTNTVDLAFDGTYLYWSEMNSPPQGAIKKIKASGSETTPTTIVSGENCNSPWGIVAYSDYIYYAESVAGESKIKRVTNEKTGTVSTLSSGKEGGLALTNVTFLRDGLDGFLYFVEQNGTSGTLCRINKTDTAQKAKVLKSGMTNPFNLLVDSVNGYVYVCEFNALPDGSIWKIKTDGTTATQFEIGLNNPAYLAIDYTGGYLYWTENASPPNGKIKRRLLDKSANTEESISSLGNPFCLLPPESGLVYFGSNLQKADNGRIKSLILSTGKAEDVLSEATDYPFVFLKSGGSFYWTSYNHPNGGPGAIRKYTP